MLGRRVRRERKGWTTRQVWRGLKARMLEDGWVMALCMIRMHSHSTAEPMVECCRLRHLAAGCHRTEFATLLAGMRVVCHGYCVHYAQYRCA